jgi:UDP-N-acetyl-D-galactosamine dehydrogenase
MQLGSETRIGVIGLGYVGLPLAVEFGKVFDTFGYDIRGPRVEELKLGQDATMEVGAQDISASARLKFTSNLSDLRDCSVFVVAVPTPVDSAKRPDLRLLEAACSSVGTLLKAGDVVVFESTVFPGCTEEVCVPILEASSGLRFNEDFYCGYSPERINPGDKLHRLTNIRKITSGSTPAAAAFVDALYSSIIAAGTCLVSSLKVAEAAKVIENTQRDLNIALVNDLAMLFNKLGIDTQEVLEAAGTKWNFLPFRPGLVGGHCIGVDPYYLTHKAQEVGHHPDVILAGRRTNDSMGPYVARQVIKLMLRKGINPVGSRVLILGLAFKENCPDFRNTRVVDIIGELEQYHVQVDVVDPWVDAAAAQEELGVNLLADPGPGVYDAVVLAVAHDEFGQWGVSGIRGFCRNAGSVLYDVKSMFPMGSVDGRL